MSTLLFSLPPLSPDYSGAATVFHDTGALVVLHDASGCTGTYTGYDEPRWFGSKSALFCSGLREIDAVMGDDDKLLRKIKHALSGIISDTAGAGVSCVAVIGSPVPMLTGFDYAGFAHLVETETGIPAFAVNATGLSTYDAGQKQAYLALAAGLFSKKDRETAPESAAKVIPGCVNLLGASVLDGFDAAALVALDSLLGERGFHRGAVWGQKSSFSELALSGNAAANWVLTAAALPLARFLQERFGTPFVVGVPIGDYETTRIFSELHAITHGKAPEQSASAVLLKNADPAPSGETSFQTLLIGEGVFCASLRAHLEQDRGLTDVTVGTFFSEGSALFRPGDMVFRSEADAKAALSSELVRRVMADPLFRALLPEENSGGIAFTDIPHRAVSGRLVCEDDERVSRYFWRSGMVNNPQGSDHRNALLRDLAEGIPVTLLTSPAAEAVFPDFPRVLAYLKTLGFREAYPVLPFADITLWLYSKLLASSPGPLFIASACVGIHRRIETLCTETSRIYSPLLSAARYLKTYAHVTDRFAFLSPCVQKPEEFTVNGETLVHYNVTVASLQEHLVRSGLDSTEALADFAPLSFSDTRMPAVTVASCGSIGGSLKTLHPHFDYTVTHGMAELAQALQPANMETRRRVLEAYFCPGGCSGGAGLGALRGTKKTHAASLGAVFQDGDEASITAAFARFDAELRSADFMRR